MDGLENGVITRFKQIVSTYPDNIAIQQCEEKLTYKELDALSDQLAGKLLSRGVTAGKRVACFQERSLNLIVSILAIFKTGAVYLPVDTSYPKKRVVYMLGNASPSIVLHDQDPKDLEGLGSELTSVQDFLNSAQLKNFEAFKYQAQVQSDLAYVIYTSGSTGQPKGVEISHLALSKQLSWLLSHFKFSSADSFLQKTPISFDASVWEIFTPLCCGARLVLAQPKSHHDPALLIKEVITNNISVLQLVPSVLRLMLQQGMSECHSLTKVFSGGEALPPKMVNDFFAASNAELHNLYGPTEFTINAMHWKCTASCKSVPIGRPVLNTSAFLLDEQGQIIEEGAIGELYLCGPQLANGYLNNKLETEKRFVVLPSISNQCLYRTGDLAQQDKQGLFHYKGRVDDQLKVRGIRVEAGEIEHAVEAINGINKAIVKLETHGIRGVELVAYLETSNDLTLSPTALRTSLELILPAQLIPQHFFTIEHFPLSPSGKIDKSALKPPAGEDDRPNLNTPYQAANTHIEAAMVSIWKEVLGIPLVGINDNFFELGGNSLLALQLIATLNEQLNLALSVLDMFESPNISGLLAKHCLTETSSAEPKSKQTIDDNSNEDIAVVGMAGRFPGARNLDQLWKNLSEGIDSTTIFKMDELDPSIPDELKHDPYYVRASGVIPEAKCFDASFFGISPREAAVIDPQQRVFLETCWEALEDAGTVVGDRANRIGIFGGTGNNTYYLSNVQPSAGNDGGIGETPRITASEKDYVTTRAAFKLGLTGPSISVQTACSTSLVAIIVACQNLRSGQASVALAGGVSITTPINAGHLYQEGSMLSPDGRTRSFDKDAKGTAFNSGAGIVVLKTLSKAKQDKDRIYGVIKGIGINNDGAEKASFTAPSIDGQRAAINDAIRDANIDARSISYVEAHGTATPLGDPIEVEALSRAFRDQSSSTDKQYCALGSIKSNVGHMVAAAGVAGLIKTCLSLYHRKLPPSLHFNQANSQIDFKNSPFFVNNLLTDWNGEKLRAGVSSFGVGGTNAHVIVEEYQPSTEKTLVKEVPELLLFSAKKQDALQRMLENHGQYFQDKPNTPTAFDAYNLQMRRKHFTARRFVITEGKRSKITALLEQLPPELSRSSNLEKSYDQFVFMFPGQGTQYPGMARALYDRFKSFRQTVDLCLSHLSDELASTVQAQLLAPESENLDKSAQELNQTQFAQLALFTTEYSLAQLWMSWGIKPAALIGHSIGEFVAATLAGVFSLEDALTLVTARGALMQARPHGAMLSVRQAATELENNLPETCAIAAINGPKLCVVAGPFDDIAELECSLGSRNIVSRRLQTSHAFHSPMMDPVLEPFSAVVAKITLKSPSLPIMSTVNATWLSDEDALNPDYWSSHLRKTVRFADGIRALLAYYKFAYLELGPRNTVSILAAQQMDKNNRSPIVSSLCGNPVPGNFKADEIAILKAIGELWLNGVNIEWPQLHTAQHPVLSLPTYPFSREEHWLEPSINNTSKPSIDLTQALLSQNQANTPPTTAIKSPKMAPKAILVNELKELFSDSSGEELADVEAETSFLELGFDSLLLTQVALSLRQKYRLNIAFRKLMEDLFNFEELANYIYDNADESVLPTETIVEQNVTPASGVQMDIAMKNTTPNTSTQITSGNVVQQLIDSQLKVMQMQLQALSNSSIASPLVNGLDQGIASTSTAIPAVIQEKAAQEKTPIKLEHSRGAKITKEKLGLKLSQAQQSWLDDVMEKYQRKYSGSKAYTQKHRKYLADPRVVSGFGPEWKEVIFPIVTKSSKGSRLTDIDDNVLIDTANGFGPIFFGHSPDFITKALKDQLDKGIETGPQSPLAGEVAKLFCEMTGNERCTFSCTGSEAVLGAIRLARTVTGRNKVVMFEGGYHGISDEVITRPGRDFYGLPASPGIPRESTSNMIVLPWGDAKSIDAIRELGEELAAVLVEPVQSRMPEFHDQEYIKAIREVTRESDTALILDEVVTGFRVAAGGIRERFNIDSDLATYGKVVGGGFPIGMIAGKAKFMDALDGGDWAFGDDSVPECGVTFYAGTFVRHPLGLAAAKAVMERIKQEGPELYEKLDKRTENMASQAKAFIKEMQCQVTFEEFSSLFYLTVPTHAHWGHLLFMLMRMEGIHIQHNRANFLTTAHSEDDVKKILHAFKKSLSELISHGLLEGDMVAAKRFLTGSKEIPKGARLGKNAQGEPAYFIEDSNRKGKYIEVGKA